MTYPNDTTATVTYCYFKDGNLEKMDYPASGPPDVSYTYETDYDRVKTRSDGAGTWNYAYYGLQTVGGGQINTINGPFADDTIKLTYDNLGRLDKRERR